MFSVSSQQGEETHVVLGKYDESGNNIYGEENIRAGLLKLSLTSKQKGRVCIWCGITSLTTFPLYCAAPHRNTTKHCNYPGLTKWNTALCLCRVNWRKLLWSIFDNLIMKMTMRPLNRGKLLTVKRKHPHTITSPAAAWTMLPCCLYHILTLPCECHRWIWDSHQGTFFQSSIVHFSWAYVNLWSEGNRGSVVIQHQTSLSRKAQ